MVNDEKLNIQLKICTLLSEEPECQQLRLEFSHHFRSFFSFTFSGNTTPSFGITKDGQSRRLSLVTFFSRTLHFFLTPLGQPKYVSDFLGGIILGPSVLGRNETFSEAMFSLKGLMVLDVYEMIGIIIYTFLIVLRIDLTMVRRRGELALAIGLGSFLFPLLINGIMAKLLKRSTKMDNKLQDSVVLLGTLASMINYDASSSILRDLKLVNSQIGLVILPSAMISSPCTWIYDLMLRNLSDAQEGVTHVIIATSLCRVLLILVIIFAIRPMMFWMIRQTPEDKTLKESYVCAIAVMILGISIYSEVTEIHPTFSSIVFGLAVPGGPPLA
ncbi:unnamed protein product [Ilex paraguariensis]|uniref:Cation/H+ exchanger transmembrane domain-containing protein n=1 Tax=Ilex paraguariensis TaxID=185542 RepID=A0ABC8SA68_9AQUA